MEAPGSWIQANSPVLRAKSSIDGLKILEINYAPCLISGANLEEPLSLMKIPKQTIGKFELLIFSAKKQNFSVN